MKNLPLTGIFLLSLGGLFSLTNCAGSTPTMQPVTPPVAESSTAIPLTTEPTTAESVVGIALAKASIGKVMVLDFPLNDLTNLPNPPEELARIAHFNVAFKQRLVTDGVEIVPLYDKIKAISATQSATYLFDHTDIAANLAEGSGAKYIIISVAMKPTYLFVYPRLLLVDVKTRRKAFTAYVQMEGSWLDNSTTSSSANRLACKVSEELKKLVVEAN